MPQCSALNCKNRGAHLFPKDPKRRKLWENALCIKNFKANNTARLCAKHFKENDYYGKSDYTGCSEPLAKFLKKTAVPSIFCFTKKVPVKPAAIDRQLRLEKRSLIKLFNDQDKQPSTSQQATKNEVVSDTTEEQIVSKSILPVTIENLEFSSKSTQVDHEHIYGSIHRFKEDNKSIQFYTGFECYEKFEFVYATLSPMVHKIRYYGSNVINLSSENQFFLTLMKLRQNKCNYELSLFFNVSETTVSNIFITWINFMYQLWSKIDIWPSKELVKSYMAEHFKKYDENIRVSETVEQSDLMTKCQSDSILADRGFTVQDMFADKDAAKIPCFLKRKSQLSGLTKVTDTDLASEHMHIGRIIGLTKNYKILKCELNHSYVPIASKIFFVCYMCCYFKESIMKNKT